ncbi:MAG TPA: glutamyl-tRNA reductase [Thermoleophilaceae bacterium]|nr:glutamyl-tRNA reductase [Thermoleophilaceae bacterium]
MSGELLALGVSHKTAPLELRERLALTEGRATAVLAELTAHEEIHEAVAISTCNRTELYLVATDAVAAESAALAVLARQAETRPTELADSLYALRDLDVARHLFQVAAGLDSMIVGESEIQGQVKRAYELALVEGMTGPIANRLFRDALAAGKRVRTDTGVGRSRVSVATVAAELACRSLGIAGGAAPRATDERCPAGEPDAAADTAGPSRDDAAAGVLPPHHLPTGDLSDRRVLVIGAGEQGELTAQALKDRGAHAVFVANRHYDRALGLAERYSGSAVPLDQLPNELAQADIVVSCTSSPHQLVGREELALVLDDREDRPLAIIDIAVPRDIDPGVRDLPGVSLYDMDDLEHEVERNTSVRQAEAERALALVERDVERFEAWLASLEVLPTIRGLRERADTIVAQVLAENAPRWESLSDADRERVAAMSRALVARLFHEPTMRLRDGAEDESSYVNVAVLRELFGLDPSPAPLDEDEQPSAEVTELDSRRHRRR